MNVFTKTCIALLLIMGLSASTNATVYFDESNATLAGGASASYMAGAIPDSTPNVILLSSGTAIGNVHLEPGRSYKVIARRWSIPTNANVQYRLTLDNTSYTTDPAWDTSVGESFQEKTLFSNYIPTSTNTSVELSNGGLWNARIDYIKFEETPLDDFWESKLAVIGSTIHVRGTVSAAFTDSFYIESDDRSCGVRVRKTAHGLAVGAIATIYGIMRTSNDGERYVDATSVIQNGTGNVDPLGITVHSLGGTDIGDPNLGMGQRGVTGGSGANNIGLLVRTWGRATFFENGRYSLTDGSGSSTIVQMPTGTTIPDGDFVVLTGISSCEASGQNINRLLRVGDSGIVEPQILTVQNQGLSLTLASSSNNYALSSVSVDGVNFDSGLKFPTFELYTQDGSRVTLAPDSSGWTTDLSVIGNTATVYYGRPGFCAQVTYEVNASVILVNVTPLVETGYKALSVSGGNSLATVAKSKTGASSTAFILTPFGGGEILRYPSINTTTLFQHWQDWWYSAQFFGIAYNNCGLLFRCPQYGAQFTYGADTVESNYSLTGDMKMYFRPAQITDFAASPVDASLQIQITKVGDANNDGVFDWVDMGTAYRDSFIRPNTSLDPNFYYSISGKIDLSAPFEGVQSYDQTLGQIRQIDFARQLWWLVGAHTPADHHYCDPPYSAVPSSDHGDYFAFKGSARAELGACIGLHEMGQMVSADNVEWGQVPLCQYQNGLPLVTAEGLTNGRSWMTYGKAIDDPSFFNFIDYHFQDWQVEAGDTWHWDVFTAESSQDNYDPAHYATRGKDLRNRIAVLQYIKNKGIHMTSEGLQEGLAEYCDAAWATRTDTSPEYSSAQLIPLVPVLFQGRTYYYSSLLYGGKYCYESIGLDTDALKSNYFSYVVPWQRIAKRTVQDVNQATDGWDFYYRTDQNPGMEAECSPVTGTALYTGLDARVIKGSDGSIRRYNFTAAGAVDATTVTVATVSFVGYAGYDGVVTKESDGKIRRYNFYTGGNMDLAVSPPYSVSSMLYTGFKGCVIKDSQSKIRRFDFTNAGSNDVTLTPYMPASEVLRATYDALVAKETDGKIRYYNLAAGGSIAASFRPVATITSVLYASSSGVVIRESDGKIRRYNFATGGGADVEVVPVAGITTVCYTGFDGVVIRESDGNIRRYNFAAPGNHNDVTATPVSGISSINYSGFDGVVIKESDGKVRRYDFFTGGGLSGVASPVSGISTIPYAGLSGVVIRESDGKVRRYSFTASGNLDSVAYPIATIQADLLGNYDGVVTRESDGKVRCYNLNYIDSMSYNATTNSVTFTYHK